MAIFSSTLVDLLARLDLVRRRDGRRSGGRRRKDGRRAGREVQRLVEPLEDRTLLSASPLADTLHPLVLKPGSQTSGAAAMEASVAIQRASINQQIAAHPTGTQLWRMAGTNAGAGNVLGGVTGASVGVVPKASGARAALQATGDSTPSAATAYTTGFEPTEGYVPGVLGSQQGWQSYFVNPYTGTDTNTTPSQPVINDSWPVLYGSQNLAISYEPGLPDGSIVAGFSPDPGLQSPGTYDASVDMLIMPKAGPYWWETGGSNYYVAVLATPEGWITANLCFYSYNGNGYVLFRTNVSSTNVDWIYTGLQWEPGYAFHLDITLDATTNQINYYYNGYLMFRGGVWGMPIAEQVACYSDNQNQTDQVTAYFDNVTVTKLLLAPARANLRSGNGSWRKYAWLRGQCATWAWRRPSRAASPGPR